MLKTPSCLLLSNSLPDNILTRASFPRLGNLKKKINLGGGASRRYLLIPYPGGGEMRMKCFFFSRGNFIEDLVEGRLKGWWISQEIDPLGNIRLLGGGSFRRWGFD